ncbi:MAG: hypothetical protein ABI353_24285, partial [Isosphaeraceae bacterium]
MQSPKHVDDDPEDAARLPGWKTVAVVLAFHAACLAVATYPFITRIRSTFPGGWTDPYQHLWIMRWYKSCLHSGRSPLICPDLQYPVGAPLGLFSPLHYQSLLYIPLSFIIPNDYLCYNLIWISSLLLTGLGTTLLIWHVLRDRLCAGFGGMLAMLGTPVLIHSFAHLELITLGWFPMFLVAWLRFVDQPGRGRLLAASAAYVLVAMSAAYYAVFAVLPAALYVAWSWAKAGRGGTLPWLRMRFGWLLGFTALVGAALIVLFTPQIWATTHGYLVNRPRSEFLRYGAPAWSYVVPTPFHQLSKVMTTDPYRLAKVSDEGFSYLGVVPLMLIALAAVCRVRFPRAWFWWAATLMFVVLSFGASWRFGSVEVGLPASWLRNTFFAFRLIRVPARFNLFAAVGAALLASVGLRHLLARLPRIEARLAIVAALTVLTIADLSMVPYRNEATPNMPACYEMIKRINPHANLCESPHFGTSDAEYLSAACGYWQSRHGLRTSSGYSGNTNIRAENLTSWPSPFSALWLEQKDFLKDPVKVYIDLVSDVSFDDYAWLYLATHHFDFVVVHHWDPPVPSRPMHLARLEAQLRPAKIFEDEMTSVYQTSRLKPPVHPVALPTEGWLQRTPWRGTYSCAVAQTAKVSVYNPDPDREVRFVLNALAFRKARTVRLRSRGRDLATWNLAPGKFQDYVSPSFRLPEGLQELTLESDGQERPAHHHEEVNEGDRKPYSLRAGGIALIATQPELTTSPNVAIHQDPVTEAARTLA